MNVSFSFYVKYKYNDIFHWTDLVEGLVSKVKKKTRIHVYNNFWRIQVIEKGRGPSNSGKIAAISQRGWYGAVPIRIF